MTTLLIPSHLIVSIFSSLNIYTSTLFFKVTISFNQKEDLLKPAIRYWPVCITLILSLGRSSHGCRISPAAKLCFCSPTPSRPPVKTDTEREYVNSDCLDTIKFYTVLTLSEKEQHKPSEELETKAQNNFVHTHICLCVAIKPELSTYTL